MWRAACCSNILIERVELTDDTVLRTAYAPNLPLLEALNRDIERIDLGIRAIRIVPGTQGPFAQFDHYGLKLDPLPASNSKATALGSLF